MDGAAVIERAERGGCRGTPGGLDRARPVDDEERLPAEAGVALAAVGVEDPEGRPPAGRSGAVAGDEDLGGLTDDVPSETDPGPPGELEADPRPLPDRRGHRSDEPRRLEDEEADPRPAGEGGEAAEAIREPGGALRPGRQVHDEEVHGPAGQERARDREALLGVGRAEDDEPFRTDAAGHRLDRVEGGREVQPGHDRATRLGRRGEPEGERGPPAREVALEREAHPARQAAGSQDPVQLREPGREDAGRIGGAEAGAWIEAGAGIELELLGRGGGHRQGADHLAGGARRGRSPARSKGRQGRRHVRREGRHQAFSIEHMFE
jgi:hypothetical protein